MNPKLTMLPSLEIESWSEEMLSDLTYYKYLEDRVSIAHIVISTALGLYANDVLFLKDMTAFIHLPRRFIICTENDKTKRKMFMRLS
ncbi:MAG: hypothetical protein Q4D16_18360 [Eubacteriales bacterium]|nr:hypothetical protein [Eubacteriales bacterium]